MNVSCKNLFKRMKGLGLVAGLCIVALFSLAQTNAALAADAPDLGMAATFGVLSGTYTNTVAGTTINGDLGYSTGPAAPATVNGTIHDSDGTWTQAGIDQGTALGDLNAQACVSLGGGAVNLDNAPGHPTGIYTPGCYSSGGAMNITVGQTVTLNGVGVYIFRPGGALTTQANTQVVLAGGACESDVYWTPIGATTLGANTNFVGNIFRGTAAGLSITLGNPATLTGRALAFGSTVTTNGANTITVPICAPVPPPGGVTLGKVFNPSTITTGGVSTLTITLSNNNVGEATLDTDFIDNLPSGMTTVGSATTTCGGLLLPIVTATSVTLPAGATIPGGTPGTCTVTVNVTMAADGSLINLIAPGALHVDITDGEEDVSNTIPVSVTLNADDPTPIPTLNEWGAIFFMVFAGLGSVYYLRKYRSV